MKLALIIIGIIVLVAYVPPLFSKILNMGNAVGIVLGALSLLSGIKYNGMSLDMRKWAVFIVFMSAMFILSASVMLYRKGRTNATDEKVVVVLGCKVKGDRPSLALLKRVDSAYKYMMCHPESVAILSGGQGKDEKISEAECMRRLLRERGIGADRLFTEEHSTSTTENIRYSLSVLDENGLDRSIAVATSEYHLHRAGLICRKYGIGCSFISSRTRIDLLPTFLLREVMAVVKETIVR